MCLYIEETVCDTNWLGQPKASIATEDMPVFKVLMQLPDNALPRSPYQEETYRPGELKKSRMHKNGFFGLYGMAVHHGLHAALTLSRAESIAWSVDTRPARRQKKVARIYEAIIPKGAKYYVGEREEIVSNRLIVGEMVVPDYERGAD